MAGGDRQYLSPIKIAEKPGGVVPPGQPAKQKGVLPYERLCAAAGAEKHGSEVVYLSAVLLTIQCSIVGVAHVCSLLIILAHLCSSSWVVYFSGTMTLCRAAPWMRLACG